MTKPTRDISGRFTGSTGSGHVSIPTSSDIPVPQHPDASPVAAEPGTQPVQSADDAYRAYRSLRATQSARTGNTEQPPAHPVNPDGTPMTPRQALDRYNEITDQLQRIQHRADSRARSINYHPHTYDGQAAWAREDRAVRALWAEQDALRPHLPEECRWCENSTCTCYE